MVGTIINVTTVLVGGGIGLLVGRKLPDKYVKSIFQVIGLFTLSLGVFMFLKEIHLLVIIFSLIIGVLIGKYFEIELKVNSLVEALRDRLKDKTSTFAEGLMTSFLIFCMGSLTILGAVEEGLGQGPELLITKSIMDGFAAMMLASALGRGVLFSVIPLLIYQGGLTLSAYYFGQYIPEYIISDLTATGGLILLGLGFNLLELKKIEVINMLPSLVFVILFSWIYVVLESKIDAFF